MGIFNFFPEITDTEKIKLLICTRKKILKTLKNGANLPQDLHQSSENGLCLDHE